MLGSKKRLSWKIRAPLEGQADTKPFVPDLHLVRPSTGFLSPGGLWAQVALHLKQFVFKECARPAGSHRINEAKRGNGENNNKNHECNQDTLTCKGRMKIFVLRFCKKYLYTWPHFSQNSECCTLFTLLPLPLGPPLTTQG